ncbi:MAG: DUF2125 domain-containing protein [Pseudomonadota bacterium]
MRKLLGLLVVLCVLWAGWWAMAGYGLRSGIAAWFEARAAEGWQADYAAVTGDGDPIRIVARIQEPALADPATGLAFEAEDLRFSSPIWWPGDVTLDLPAAPMMLASPQGRSFLTMADGAANLRLRPGTALELETLSLTAGAWGLTDPAGALVQADTLVLSALQGDVSERYEINLSAAAFRPGDVPRAAMGLPDDWPLTFDRLEMQANITFDRPWDRRALEDMRPQPRRIVLDLAEAAWSDLRINLAADLTIDESGVPTGRLNLQAENWPRMLDLAETAGILSPRMRLEAERGLSMLAGLSGNPASLDVQLNLAGGFMAVGILPIGPAPRLVIR